MTDHAAMQEPGIDLSNPPLELGEYEQQAMDLLTSKTWFVTAMERKAAPVAAVRSDTFMDWEVTLTIKVLL